MKAFLRGVSLIALLRMAVSMLLPEGATRRVCDWILGLTALTAMLSAARALLSGWIG